MCSHQRTTGPDAAVRADVGELPHVAVERVARVRASRQAALLVRQQTGRVLQERRRADGSGAARRGPHGGAGRAGARAAAGGALDARAAAGRALAALLRALPAGVRAEPHHGALLVTRPTLPLDTTSREI